jgi:hypothetical protein
VLEKVAEQRAGLHGFRHEGRREQDLGEMHAGGAVGSGHAYRGDRLLRRVPHR